MLVGLRPHNIGLLADRLRLHVSLFAMTHQ